jgi:hypothetical protein
VLAVQDSNLQIRRRATFVKRNLEARMGAVMLRRSYDRELTWWVAAMVLLLAFTLVAMAPMGVLSSHLSHWVAYLLLTGQINAWAAVGMILAVLPWWLPRSGLLISVLYEWAQIVIAFGWEGLAAAIASISWTGIGALVVVLVGAALLG